MNNPQKTRFNGKLAEWSNAVALKSTNVSSVHQFESDTSRKSNMGHAWCRRGFLSQPPAGSIPACSTFLSKINQDWSKSQVKTG